MYLYSVQYCTEWCGWLLAFYSFIHYYSTSFVQVKCRTGTAIRTLIIYSYYSTLYVQRKFLYGTRYCRYVRYSTILRYSTIGMYTGTVLYWSVLYRVQLPFRFRTHAFYCGEIWNAYNCTMILFSHLQYCATVHHTVLRILYCTVLTTVLATRHPLLYRCTVLAPRTSHTLQVPAAGLDLDTQYQ